MPATPPTMPATPPTMPLTDRGVQAAASCTCADCRQQPPSRTTEEMADLRRRFSEEWLAHPANPANKPR